MQVNRSKLAELFDVSLPTIDVWVRANCPVVQRGSRGVEWVFNTADVMTWRMRRAVAEATGEKVHDKDALDLRKLAAQAERAELELLQAKGLVAPIREFERAMAKMCAEVRANVLNVPQRVVTQLIGCTDESEFKTKLRAELVLALQAANDAEITLEDEEDEADDVDS